MARIKTFLSFTWFPDAQWSKLFGGKDVGGHLLQIHQPLPLFQCPPRSACHLYSPIKCIAFLGL